MSEVVQGGGQRNLLLAYGLEQDFLVFLKDKINCRLFNLYMGLAAMH